MKSKGCLIALGIVGALAVVAFVAVSTFLSKAKDFAESVAEGVGVAPAMVEQAEVLNEKFEFTIPEDNLLTEAQIETFIRVKEDFADRLKEHLQTLEALDQKTKHDEAELATVVEAWKTLGKIHRDFLASLERHEMSPKEYAYLSGQVYSAYLSEVVREGQEQMKQGVQEAKGNYEKQMQQFEEQLKDPNLTEDARKALLQLQEQYKQMLEQSQQTVDALEREVEEFPQQNVELLNKFREKLEGLNTFGYELWGLALTEGQ